MGDQVQFLNKEPKHFQINEPNAPCEGHSTCTDSVVAMIVFHETGRLVSAHDVRQAGAPGKDPCKGLNPTEALRALEHFGVRGYQIHVNATAEDAIRATDSGVVLVAVGYNGFPTDEESEVGGKTDVGFTGPHAISLWGRRNVQVKPANWPKGKAWRPGWRVWTRDPDHHWGEAKPPYDRFRSSFLVRAMDALIGNGGWQVRLIIAREKALWRPKLLAKVESHQIQPLADDMVTYPDFGAGQQG